MIVLAVMFTFVFNWQVLMPLLAEVSFNAGPKEFGLLSAAAGIGSLVGAVTTAHGNRRPGMGRLGVFSLLVGGSMVLVALAPTLGFAMLTMVPLGYAAMCFMITGNTMLQLNAKPQARGRVMALYGIVFLGSTPIGAPIAGWLGQLLGPRVEFALIGRGGRRDRGHRAVDARSPRDPPPTGCRQRSPESEHAPGAAADPRRADSFALAEHPPARRSPRSSDVDHTAVLEREPVARVARLEHRHRLARRAPLQRRYGSPASLIRRSICARCETSHGNTGVHARNTIPITTSVAPGDSTGNSATASTAATSRAML